MRASLAAACAAALVLAVPAAGAPALRAEIVGGAVHVEGKPFLPLVTWAQCAATVEETLALGVNVFMGDSCDDPEALAAAVAGRAYLVLDYNHFDRIRHDLPGLIGWHQPDEPEAWGYLPESLRPVEPAHAVGHLVFENFTAHFASDAAPPDRVPKSAYPAYVAKTDVVSFDLYPVAHYCPEKAGHDGITVDSVFTQQLELVQLAAGRPTFQWIELNDLEHWCPAPTAAQVRAEIWLAVAGGARGMGYFTHGWPEGIWTHFYVAADIQAEVARSNRELTELAPVLLSPSTSVRAQGGVRAGARRLGNAIWVVAVNPTDEPRTATIHVPRTAGRWAVWGESRNVGRRNGAVRGHFGPYEVRVYRFNAAR
ncbi:MAG: hypothetical protein WD689_06820 [Gaiellaceae bacterium]